MPDFLSRSLLVLLVFTSITSIDRSVSAAEPVFRAGAAVATITPPLGENVIGGFAPFPATAIHDDLHARCLILDNGKTQLGFVICDNLGIRKDIYAKARKLIASETGFPVENLLMAATHTHSATPSSSGKYEPILVRGIADSVKQALKNLAPARIGWTGIDEPSEVFNRRWYVTDPELLKNPFGEVDKVRMNPPRGSASLVKPAGPIDPEISILSVQSTDGRQIALLANYSLHYVGGVNKGDVSADYFGIFSSQIGDALGAKEGCVGMLSNGTSGDINNINFREKGPSKKPYEKMDEVARLVVKRVTEAQQSVKYHDWVPLGVANRSLTLKVRKPDAAMQTYFAGVRAKPEGAEKFHRYETNYADRVQNLLEGPDEIDVPLQAIRIGELGIAAIPFETFVEIGLEIKDKTPFADAFTIELANDYNGYLPTPEQHKLGGYETWMGTNKVQLDASDRITEIILDLMAELHKEN